MLNVSPQLQLRQAFSIDAYGWLKGLRHGHMGKWQYGEPLHETDPVRGAPLWDVWERVAKQHEGNMLSRQGQVWLHSIS